jgi:SAM-dependent methyltransferase
VIEPSSSILSADKTTTRVEKPVAFHRVLRRLQCTFLPWTVLMPRRGTATREYWEDYSTAHFQELSETCHTLMQEVMRVSPDRNATIVDMGRNVGRHLNFLYEAGYRNLCGVDFSSTALSEMVSRYPLMHAAGQFYEMSFEEFLTKTDRPVDLAYTRGATFELMHPSFPLIKELCSRVRRHVVLAIHEAGHYYPRCWEYEFARQGFELVKLQRQLASHLPRSKIVTFLTFERITPF